MEKAKKYIVTNSFKTKDPNQLKQKINEKISKILSKQINT